MENSNIGVLGLSLAISHADCSPFISGMAKSRTITSGFNSRALLTASRPSTASPQISQSGCRPSRLRTCCRTSALSSAIKIRAGKSASIKHWDQQRSGINLCRRRGGNTILLRSQEYVNGTMAIDEWHGGAPIEACQLTRQSPTDCGKNSISPLFWGRIRLHSLRKNWRMRAAPWMRGGCMQRRGCIQHRGRAALQGRESGSESVTALAAVATICRAGAFFAACQPSASGSRRNCSCGQIRRPELVPHAGKHSFQ